MPIWLKNYDCRLAWGDFTAALIVVVMLVPQSLAYAQLARMPLEAGLYASIFPLIAYAIFGSSSTLSVGPVAVISLMTATSLAAFGPVEPHAYLLLAAWLALLSGLMLFAAGILRLGFVANLISHPVLAGFMSGAAVLIILGQLKPLLGMDGTGTTALALAQSLYRHRASVSWPTAYLGMTCVALLVLLPRLLRRLSGPQSRDVVVRLVPLLLVVLATLTTAYWELDIAQGVAVVGNIPASLPPLGMEHISLEQLRALLLPAFALGLIGFVESVSVAQALGARRKERIAPDAELRGLGAANIAAALSGGFPVTGGLSRSVVNFSAGARTPGAGVFTALMMLMVVTTMTQLFARLPICVLAAAIIVPVAGLIDTATLRHAWRYSPIEAVAYLGTACGVLTVGIELGILLGVAISVLAMLWQASRPHIAEIGRVPGTVHYRNVKRAEVETVPEILAMRIDGDIFFANIRPITDEVLRLANGREKLAHVVLDMSAVNRIDLTGLEGLQTLLGNLAAREVLLSLAEVKGPILDSLRGSTLMENLGPRVYRFTHDAIAALGVSQSSRA